MASIDVDVSATIKMTSGPTAVLAKTVGATDSLTMSLLGEPGLGKLVRENVALTDVQAPQTTYRREMLEAIALRDRLRRGVAVQFGDLVQLSAALSDQLGLSLRDGIGAAEIFAGAGRFHSDYTESVRLSDSAFLALAGFVAETIGVASSLQGVALFDQLLADTIDVDDTITSAPLLLQVVADDTVEITPTEALQMFYAGHLSDTVQVTAIYPSISGSVTTWALNTKTGSLTEYADYAFNSFAQLSGLYLGAADDGLYELTGDTDDGDGIIAEIETGLAQITGSRFTSFRAAYLAVRGGGQFVLRLETGDGKVYNYAVTADHMETTKVQLGKGLRARYFSFTLISAGQDFDLEALEFVPIAARRRV